MLIGEVGQRQGWEARVLDSSRIEEMRRLEAVRRYDILDTPPDGAFERITALASRLLGTPISIVSVVDEDRIWFKSHHGVEVEEVDREPGLCASAILQEGPWIVADAKSDPRTLANSLVAGEFGLQFYAGVPLTTFDGFNLGTLCVLDQEPREISAEEVETLSDLASLVVDELELRLAARRALELEGALRRNAEHTARTLQQSLLPIELPAVEGFRLAARYHVANKDEVGGDFYDVVPTPSGLALGVGDACGKGTEAAGATGAARWTLRTIFSQEWNPAVALTRLNELLARHPEDPRRYVTIALASLTLDSEGAKCTLSLGGHPKPLVVRGKGSTEAIGEAGPLIGWSQGVKFEEVTVQLFKGDTLVMFTDGLLETTCGHGETSDARLRELLNPLAGKGPEAIADALDAAVGDEMTDDVGFLVVELL